MVRAGLICRGAAPSNTLDNPDHGRIETRNIWVTSELNDYLNFPYVGQAFLVERITINKKTGKESRDIAYGITSKTAALASPEQVLQDNRKHWSIENSCHYIMANIWVSFIVFEHKRYVA